MENEVSLSKLFFMIVILVWVLSQAYNPYTKAPTYMLHEIALDTSIIQSDK